eukprot:jgi/Tetstr1/457890/TSEL_044409.t1
MTTTPVATTTEAATTTTEAAEMTTTPVATTTEAATTTTEAAEMTTTPVATTTKAATTTTEAAEMTTTPVSTTTEAVEITTTSAATTMGLSVEDFNSGGQQIIEQAVADVVLGDASYSNFVDVEMVDDFSLEEEPVQRQIPGLVVRISITVPSDLYSGGGLPVFQPGFDVTWTESLKGQLATLDAELFSGIVVTEVDPPTEMFPIFLQGVFLDSWEEDGGEESFLVAAAKVLTGDEANVEYFSIDVVRELDEQIYGLGLAVKLAPASGVDTSSWPLHSSDEFDSTWVANMMAELMDANSAVFGNLMTILGPGSATEQFVSSVATSINNCTIDAGMDPLQEFDFQNVDWEVVILRLFVPNMGNTAPGNSGNTPAFSGIMPGNSVNAPGRDQTRAPGNSADAPGRDQTRAPGNSANAPGQDLIESPGRDRGESPVNSGDRPGNGNGRTRRLQQAAPSAQKDTLEVLLLRAMDIQLNKLPRKFRNCVRGIETLEPVDPCARLKMELEEGTLSTDFCEEYYCSANSTMPDTNSTLPGMNSTMPGMNYTDGSVESCMGCQRTVNAISVADDMGWLDSRDVDMLCREDGNPMELFQCHPNSALMVDAGYPESEAAKMLCSIIGSEGDRECRALRYEDEPLCASMPMCRAEDAMTMDTCSAFAGWVAECESAEDGDERDVLDCLVSSDACGDGFGNSTDCDVWYNITMALEAQVVAGWDFDGVDLGGLVMDLCKFSQLQGALPLLEAVLGDDCPDGLTGNCPLRIPGNLIPDNPLARRLCDPDRHCCAGAWQLGPGLCGDSPGCEFRGRQCAKSERCVGCDLCSAALGGMSSLTTPADYLMACNSAAGTIDDVTYCDFFPWSEWLDNAADAGVLPNVVAACAVTGLCPESCVGDSLCPEAEIMGNMTSGNTTTCASRLDCEDGEVCMPHDVTDPEQFCVDGTTCDPESGFFFPSCLSTCQPRAAAVCANFRDNRLELLTDLAWTYRPDIAANISMAYEEAVDAAEAGEGTDDLMGVWEEIEAVAADFANATCLEDGDCGSGVCRTDPRCRRLNYVCDVEDLVHEMDEDFECSGFCEDGEPLAIAASSITAELSPDGSTIRARFPPAVPALRRFFEFADDVYEDADEVLGKRATLVGEDDLVTIYIGQRGPFNTSEPLVLTVLPNITVETYGGRLLFFEDSDRSVEVVFPESEPPAAPRVRLSKTWGKACAAGASDVGNGRIDIEPDRGEIWGDVDWDVVKGDSGKEALRSYLTNVNMQPDVMDKLSLSEREMVKLTRLELPAGEYVISVTVFNLLGQTTTREMNFTKEATALPTVDFGASVIQFPAGRSLRLSPVSSSLACPGRLSYMWNVTEGNLELTETDKAAIRIAPEQVSPGATYVLELSIMGESGTVLLTKDVTVRVGVSELQLSVAGASSYRDTDAFTLSAHLVDPDRSAQPARYTWDCEATGGALCFVGGAVPVLSANSYTIEADTLLPGTYTFSVTATKGGRTAMASHVVAIVSGEGNPPTGSIAVVGSGSYPNRPVNPDVPLRLEARLSGSAVAPENVTYAWLVDAAQTTDSKLDKAFLKVTETALAPGRSKSFSCTLTNVVTGASSTVVRSVAVNAPPSGGDVEVNPTEGFAYGETPFRVTTSGWVDADVDLASGDEQVLMYQFGYCDEYGCPDGSYVPITRQTGASFTFAGLPAGRVGDNLLTVRVCALDIHVASDTRLSRSCVDTDVTVEEGQDNGDVGGTISLLSTSSASALEKVQLGLNVVNRIVKGGNGGGDNNIGDLLEVFQDLSSDDDLPTESLQQLAGAIANSGGSGGISSEARARGVGALRNVANRLENLEDNFEELGESIMQGVGSMMGGFGGDSNGTERSDTANLEDQLLEILSRVGPKFLANRLPTESFLTVGNTGGATNNGAAICVGKRGRSDLSGLPVTVGGEEDRRRRLLAGELVASPEIVVPHEFADQCTPLKCPEPVEVSISFIQDSNYLFVGLGEQAFVDAVAEAEGLVDTTGITVGRVGGVLNVGMPNKKGSDLGGAMQMVIPVDSTLYDPANKLLCVQMDVVSYAPVVLGEAPPVGADSVCRCVGTQLGEYFCVQASIPSGGASPPPATAPTPAPTQAPLGTPVATPAPTFAPVEMDDEPTGSHRVASSVTFANADINTVDRLALKMAVTAAILAAIPSLSAADVAVTAIKAGSVVVEFTIAADDEEGAAALATTLTAAAGTMFDGLEGDYGTAVVGEAEVREASSGPPLGLIIGAAVAAVVVVAVVVVIVVVMCRKRAAVSNNHPSGATSQPMMAS